MSYQKQFFKDGDVLTAEQLNHMEEGIANFSEAVGIQSIKQTTTSSEDGGANIVSVMMTDGTKELLTIKNGSEGASGKSAYDYAKEGGYTGTETEFATELNNALEESGGATPEQLAQIEQNKNDIGKLYGEIAEIKHYESNDCIIPTASYTNGYIDKMGVITIAENWVYSSPIKLKKGNTLHVKNVMTYSTVATLSLYIPDNNQYIPIFKVSSGETSNIKYHAINDCYICVSKPVTNEIDMYISVVDIQYKGNIAKQSTIVDGYFIYNGNKQSNDMSQYISIPVMPLGKYTLCYENPMAKTEWGIEFAKEDGTHVSGCAITEYKNIVSYNGYDTFTFDIPKDATRVNITCKFSNECSALGDIIFVQGDSISDDMKYVAHINGNKQNYQFDKYSNISWVLIGDSLTEKNNRAITSYYDYISKETGIKLINKGCSGVGYAKFTHFYTAISSLVNVDFDFLTIFGSINDLDYSSIWEDGRSWDAALGNVDDSSNDSICGRINNTINRFYQLFPTKKIGIITPTPCAYYASNNLIVNSHMDDYVNKLVEIAKRRGVPYLDLYHRSGLRPWDNTVLEELYNENGLQDNGVHPNSIGHKWIYPMILKFIEQYMID
jgi:hypothetical protein